jgi:hypothetical protein
VLNDTLNVPSALAPISTLLLGAARDLLVAQGAFPPFGAVRHNDGRLALSATYLHSTTATPELHFRTLVDGLRAQRSALRAVGICSDIRATPPCPAEATGAVQLNIEASDGLTVEAVVPYSLVQPGNVVFFPAFIRPATPIIFTSKRRWWPLWGAAT